MRGGARMQSVETVILGAGLAGLSTAYQLGRDYLLIEREARVGGLARTETVGGFAFDWTGHWLHLRHAHNRRLVDELLGDRMVEVQRVARIWSHGVFTEYPYQANLHGLPLPVVKECLMGAIRALAGPAAGDVPRDFADYVLRHFGAGIARHFMIPYNTKLWGCPPEDITAAWCSRFVPVPSLEQIVDGALGLHQSMGYNVAFRYPRAGGIEALPQALAAHLEPARIRLETAPTRIDPARRTLQLPTGETLGYTWLVSSIPLPALIDLLADVPAPVRAARATLRYTTLRFMDVGLRSERPFDGAHWLYLPEPELPFYRIGVYSNAIPAMAPAGHAACYVECSNVNRPPDAVLQAELRALLVRLGAIERPDQIVVERFREVPVAYVVFDHAYFAALQVIRAYLEAHGILSIGRYGRWIYAAMDDALDDGFETAARIRGQAPGRNEG